MTRTAECETLSGDSNATMFHLAHVTLYALWPLTELLLVMLVFGTVKTTVSHTHGVARSCGYVGASKSDAGSGENERAVGPSAYNCGPGDGSSRLIRGGQCHSLLLGEVAVGWNRSSLQRKGGRR